MPKSLLFAIAFPILAFALFVVDGAVEKLVNRAIAYAFSGRSANPWISGVVYLYLGAVIGLGTGDLLPHRFFPVKSIFPGIGLLLASLCAGLLMQFIGSWLRRNAQESSWLATFWGGALFAFSTAFVRWHLVGAR
jgi:hypothetical protein